MNLALTILLASTTWCAAQAPFPTLSTNRVKVITARTKIYVPPIPETWGARYVDKVSLMPTQRWVSGWSRTSAAYVPHSFRHDTNTGAFALDWPSQAGQVFALEWSDNGIFYPVETVGAWSGTNRSRYTQTWEATIWPTNKPGTWRVVRL